MATGEQVMEVTGSPESSCAGSAAARTLEQILDRELERRGRQKTARRKDREPTADVIWDRQRRPRLLSGEPPERAVRACGSLPQPARNASARAPSHAITSKVVPLRLMTIKPSLAPWAPSSSCSSVPRSR